MASASNIVKKKLEEASTDLNLVDCFIGDEGATSVAEALVDNTRIRTLDLRGEFMELWSSMTMLMSRLCFEFCWEKNSLRFCIL